MTNKQNFAKFQGSKISHKEAGKIVGGVSSTYCEQLQSDWEAAMEEGDLALARQLRRLMYKFC